MIFSGFALYIHREILSIYRPSSSIQTFPGRNSRHAESIPWSSRICCSSGKLRYLGALLELEPLWSSFFPRFVGGENGQPYAQGANSAPIPAAIKSTRLVASLGGIMVLWSHGARLLLQPWQTPTWNMCFTGSIITPGKIYPFEPEIFTFYHTDYLLMSTTDSLNPYLEPAPMYSISSSHLVNSSRITHHVQHISITIVILWQTP